MLSIDGLGNERPQKGLRGRYLCLTLAHVISRYRCGEDHGVRDVDDEPELQSSATKMPTLPMV
jgi:hypothetical protein